MGTDLLPNGPYTWTLATMLWIAVLGSLISSDRRWLLPVSIVMIGNWLFVQAASDLNHVGLAAMGAASSAILLALWRHEVSVAIAILFVPRLIIYAMHPFFGMPIWIMWELSNALFVIQVSILAGGSIDGTRLLLARTFDIVCRRFHKLVAIPALWRDVCEALGPVRRITRKSFQEKDLSKHG